MSALLREGCGSVLIQRVKQLPQTTEVDTVEPEEYTWQVRGFIEVIARWIYRHNLTLTQDVAKITIQAGEHVCGRKPLEADE
jgi:hypothetical protein